jgi:hypothetical protein
MNDKVRVWKEAVVACLEVVYRNSSGETGKPRPRFEGGASAIQFYKCADGSLRNNMLFPVNFHCCCCCYYYYYYYYYYYMMQDI